MPENRIQLELQHNWRIIWMVAHDQPTPRRPIAHYTCSALRSCTARARCHNR